EALRDAAPPAADTLWAAGQLHAQLAAAIAGDDRLGPADRARRAEQHATRAVVWLRRAFEAYTAAKALDPGAWRRSRNLHPLRSRADFQALLQDVIFPADPFARASGATSRGRR